MGTWIVGAILVVSVVFAIVSSIKHLKGEGGCCGGGGSLAQTKELEEPVIGEKIIKIEGMHCENCKNSIERALNRMDGVVCKVNLKKKTASVTYSKEPADEDLKFEIKRLDFTVVDITKVER